jgi:hypothetical protein
MVARMSDLAGDDQEDEEEGGGMYLWRISKSMALSADLTRVAPLREMR